MDVELSLLHRGIRPGQRFNVLDLSSFPDSVNRSLLISSSVSAGISTVSRGVYELWNGLLKTCSTPSPAEGGTLAKGFTFQFRDAATAIRAPTSGWAVELQALSGKSRSRALKIKDGCMIIWFTTVFSTSSDLSARLI